MLDTPVEGRRVESAALPLNLLANIPMQAMGICLTYICAGIPTPYSIVACGEAQPAAKLLNEATELTAAYNEGAQNTTQ